MPRCSSVTAASPPFASIEPMLLQEAARPFNDPAWLHQVKYDGYRLLAAFDAQSVALKTRNGADATKWFPELCASLIDIGGGRHVFDGEACVLDEIGRSNFDRMHARAKMRRYKPGCDLVVYCVFDLLVYAGKDIREQPLRKRKAVLERLLRKKVASVLLVGGVPGEQGVWLYERMLDLQTEGIVSKRLDSSYESGRRSPAWLKIKRAGAVPAKRFQRTE